jgi:hypothetical protein
MLYSYSLAPVYTLFTPSAYGVLAVVDAITRKIHDWY